MQRSIGQGQFSELSALVADRIGLYFPPDRWNDLERGLAGAASELGFGDAAACAESLLSSPPTKAQIQVLASHLTIGETYFFRDKAMMDALAESILPGLIRPRRGREQRLRLWSAGCCTGEEPYSLAIILHELLPDFPEWRVTITATDINTSFLQKAAAGIYTEWSFRNAPPRLKQRYFKRRADGRYLIAPEIKRLVTFAHLNLVDDLYPSLATDTNAMDVIFCRNVLMYFTPAQAGNVTTNLRHALVDGGWLVVSPSEASKALFPRFRSVNFPGAIAFQKSDAPAAPEMQFDQPAALPLPVVEESPLRAASAPAEAEPVRQRSDVTASPDALPVAEALYQQGRYEECVVALTATSVRDPREPAAFSLLARALANQGRLAEALYWFDRWIASDKMKPANHYLRAIVLMEQGETEKARDALQRTLYLDPDFVLAHFALGNVARMRGRKVQAKKHFANALHLLRAYAPDALLPESEGLTAGRLAETITSITTADGMS